MAMVMNFIWSGPVDSDIKKRSCLIGPTSFARVNPDKQARLYVNADYLEEIAGYFKDVNVEVRTIEGFLAGEYEPLKRIRRFKDRLINELNKVGKGEAWQGTACKDLFSVALMAEQGGYFFDCTSLFVETTELKSITAQEDYKIVMPQSIVECAEPYHPELNYIRMVDYWAYAASPSNHFFISVLQRYLRQFEKRETYSVEVDQHYGVDRPPRVPFAPIGEILSESYQCEDGRGVSPHKLPNAEEWLKAHTLAYYNTPMEGNLRYVRCVGGFKLNASMWRQLDHNWHPALRAHYILKCGDEDKAMLSATGSATDPVGAINAIIDSFEYSLENISQPLELSPVQAGGAERKNGGGKSDASAVMNFVWSGPVNSDIKKRSCLIGPTSFAHVNPDKKARLYVNKDYLEEIKGYFVGLPHVEVRTIEGFLAGEYEPLKRIRRFKDRLINELNKIGKGEAWQGTMCKDLFSVALMAEQGGYFFDCTSLFVEPTKLESLNDKLYKIVRTKSAVECENPYDPDLSCISDTDYWAYAASPDNDFFIEVLQQYLKMFERREQYVVQQGMPPMPEFAPIGAILSKKYCWDDGSTGIDPKKLENASAWLKAHSLSYYETQTADNLRYVECVGAFKLNAGMWRRLDRSPGLMRLPAYKVLIAGQAGDVVPSEQHAGANVMEVINTIIDSFDYSLKALHNSRLLPAATNAARMHAHGANSKQGGGEKVDAASAVMNFIWSGPVNSDIKKRCCLMGPISFARVNPNKRARLYVNEDYYDEIAGYFQGFPNVDVRRIEWFLSGMYGKLRRIKDYRDSIREELNKVGMGEAWQGTAWKELFSIALMAERGGYFCDCTAIFVKPVELKPITEEVDFKTVRARWYRMLPENALYNDPKICLNAEVDHWAYAASPYNDFFISLLSRYLDRIKQKGRLVQDNNDGRAPVIHFPPIDTIFRKRYGRKDDQTRVCRTRMPDVRGWLEQHGLEYYKTPTTEKELRYVPLFGCFKLNSRMWVQLDSERHDAEASAYCVFRCDTSGKALSSEQGGSKERITDTVCEVIDEFTKTCSYEDLGIPSHLRARFANQQTLFTANRGAAGIGDAEQGVQVACQCILS